MAEIMARKRYSVKNIAKGTKKIKVQSDWNQNDSTQPDYIKNRIGGYEETSYTTSSYMEETTVEFEAAAELNYQYISSLSMSSAVVGATLEIVWDGAPYLCICTDDGCYGNVSLLDATRTDHNNEPFVLFYSADFMIATNSEGSHTVAVNIAKDYTSVITKIPEKYLELDNYVRTENLPEQVQPDWSQNDETQSNYVKNRFGGYEDYERTVILEETNFTFVDGEVDQLGIDQTTINFNTIDMVVDGISHIAIQEMGSSYIVYYEGESVVGSKVKYTYDADRMTLREGFEDGNHTIAIYGLSDEPVAIPIPEKYLPDTVATKTYVDNKKPIKTSYSGNLESVPDDYNEISVDIPTSGLYLITFSYIMNGIDGDESIHLELGNNDCFIANGPYNAENTGISTLSASGSCVTQLEAGTQRIAIVCTTGTRVIEWIATLTRLGD